LTGSASPGRKRTLGASTGHRRSDRYLKVISVIEGIHQTFAELTQAELDHIGADNVTIMQALILLNVGDAKVTVNELRNRINHLGSHLNYMIRKLSADKYLLYERSRDDPRALCISLSDKGRALRARLIQVHDHHVANCSAARKIAPEIGHLVQTLRQIEQFWIDLQLDASRDRSPHRKRDN
jgi:DNA-binding MarR family transcriptional regulator